MSALGHERTQWPVRVMSALLPTADIRQCAWDVRKVPEADIGLGLIEGRLAGVSVAGDAVFLW